MQKLTTIQLQIKKLMVTGLYTDQQIVQKVGCSLSAVTRLKGKLGLRTPRQKKEDRRDNRLSKAEDKEASLGRMVINKWPMANKALQD